MLPHAEATKRLEELRQTVDLTTRAILRMWEEQSPETVRRWNNTGEIHQKLRAAKQTFETTHYDLTTNNPTLDWQEAKEMALKAVSLV